MRVVDTHCHLALVEGGPQVAMAAARAAGVEWVVDIGMGLEGSAAAVATAEASGGAVLASVGLHPNDLSGFSAEAMQRLATLAEAPSVVGIGETGLDHYRDGSPRDMQEASFRAHIDLAVATGATLVIHCRDASDEVIAVLDDAPAPARVIMHCFSGDVAHAKACVDRGYYCSFAGNLTYASAEDLRSAAAMVPDELVLVETDAPFLAPVPKRGKRNQPAFVVHTAEALAQIRGQAKDALGERLVANAAAAFDVDR